MTELKPLDRKGMGSRAQMYPVETVDAALTVLAALGGNASKAHDQLAEQGIEIPVSTLRSWKTRTYPDRYLEIREVELPKIKAELAEKAENAAAANWDLTLKFSEALKGALEAGEIDAKDLGRNLRETSIAAGIATQRSADLRGESTLIIERKDPAEILKALERLGVIDSTAEEIPPKQIGS